MGAIHYSDFRDCLDELSYALAGSDVVLLEDDDSGSLVGCLYELGKPIKIAIRLCPGDADHPNPAVVAEAAFKVNCISKDDLAALCHELEYCLREKGNPSLMLPDGESNFVTLYSARELHGIGNDDRGLARKIPSEATSSVAEVLWAFHTVEPFFGGLCSGPGDVGLLLETLKAARHADLHPSHLEAIIAMLVYQERCRECGDEEGERS